jgi:hypothetical protein
MVYSCICLFSKYLSTYYVSDTFFLGFEEVRINQRLLDRKTSKLNALSETIYYEINYLTISLGKYE